MGVCVGVGVVIYGREPEDVSLLKKCPHFRGCYIQSSMELGPEDVLHER